MPFSAWNTPQRRTVGIYNAHLLDFLHKLHFPIWLESSLQIKKAGGLQRGKTDSIDAQRIADRAPGGVRLPVPRPTSPVGAAPRRRAAVGHAQFGPPAADRRL